MDNAYLLQPWFDIIMRDLLAARACMHDGDDLAYPVGYHLQQAAEKLVKVVITAHDLDIRRTHEIDALIDEIPAESPFINELRPLAALGDFATAGRYPGEPEPGLSLKEALHWHDKIAALAQKIRDHYPEAKISDDI